MASKAAAREFDLASCGKDLSMSIEQAERLLQDTPMTRRELERALNTTQQRVSEILRKLDAHIVGYVPAPKQGRPAPIYAVGDTQEASREWKFGRVNSVFALGGVA
jgi:predicted transcriptional regulator